MEEDEEGRLGAEDWASFEHPDLKLISIIAERDAALLERNAALAEKKVACTERDAALLQRDLAYSDRNSAIMERDAAIAALEYAKSGHLNGRTDVCAKVLQVLAHNSAFTFRESHQNPYPLAPTSTATVFDEPQKQIKKKEQKRKLGISTEQAPRPKTQRKQATGFERDDSNLPHIAVKHEWKDHDHNDDGDGDGDGDGDEDNTGVSTDASAMPIPACSCTGMLQQCYRWGNGGWQSACCTNNVSMYPLPINLKKKGTRVPGRKMSGGAFRKLLRKLSAEGLNCPQPIDLKNHWARHGTNRYVTIK